MRATAMIMAIVMARCFCDFVITAVGLTAQVNAMVTGVGLSPTQTLVAVVVFYVLLG